MSRNWFVVVTAHGGEAMWLEGPFYTESEARMHAAALQIKHDGEKYGTRTARLEALDV